MSVKYERLQEKWVENNGIAPGTTVKVVRRCLNYDRGWDNVWTNEMDSMIGATFKVSDSADVKSGVLVPDGRGIRLDTPNNAGYRLPFFCLEKTKPMKGNTTMKKTETPKDTKTLLSPEQHDNGHKILDKIHRLDDLYRKRLDLMHELEMSVEIQRLNPDAFLFGTAFACLVGDHRDVSKMTLKLHYCDSKGMKIERIYNLSDVPAIVRKHHLDGLEATLENSLLRTGDHPSVVVFRIQRKKLGW